jgi:molybdenum cofactor cytidylyltransferase
MVGLIILAAGSSSRLGKPKQNLIFQGGTLLQRSVKAALAADCQQIVAVLGANAPVIEPTIADQPIQIIHNSNWETGMSSSIHFGLTALLKTSPQIKSVILMLCDQPFADTSIINQLIQASAHNKHLVACNYNGTIGVPALFDKSHFEELLALQGNEGAKKLLLKYKNEVHTVPFPLGMIDIDTVGDFERLEIRGN